MRRRLLWLALGLALVVVVAATVALLMLPRLAHDAAVWQLRALTRRPVAIEALDLSLASGTLSVRGVHVADHDGGRLADVERLEIRFRPRDLLRARLAIDDLTVSGVHLRVVRVGPDRFNISDLLERPAATRQLVDITVARLALAGSTIAVEDRVLTPARTWRAEDVRLDAHDVGTLGRTGTAAGSTTVAGALISLRADQVQLAPLHLRAWINVRDFDLRLAALYVPADEPVTLERGRLHAGLTVVVDGAGGTGLDADAVVETFALRRPGLAGDALTAPELQVLIRDLHWRPGAVALRYASVGGDLTVLDATTATPRRLTFSDFTATASGLEQAMRGQVQVALHANIPGGGEVDVSGTAGLTPSRADLRVRARGIEVATLGPYLPITGRLEGRLGADVRVAATHAGRLALTIAGDASLDRVGLGDGARTLAGATRLAVTGLQYTWPATVRAQQLTMSEPGVTLERDQAGALALAALVTPLAAPPGAAAPATDASAEGPQPDVGIARLRIQGGRALVSDAASGVRADVRGLEVTAEGLAWPGQGPASVRVTASVDGARVRAQGVVDAARRSVDLAIRVGGADLVVLRPWLPIVGGARGAADADVRVVAAHDGGLKLTVTGDATLQQVALPDGPRPLAGAARIAATGVEYTWPASLRVARLAVSRPTATLERDAAGALNLAALLQRPPAADGQAAAPGAEPSSSDAADVAIGQLQIEDGRVTFVDVGGGRVEVARLDVTARGLAWPPRAGSPVQLSAALAGGTVTARGTVDLAARKSELAITLRGADLTTLQPWLPIVGRVGGAADADVTVVAALDPFALSVRGAVSAADVAFLEGDTPLIRVGRVDVAGLDLRWPTLLAVDRLRVEAPWARIERDPQGVLSLRTLFARRPGLPAPAPVAPAVAAVAGPVPGLQVTVRDALFDNGGLSIVDDAVEPAAHFEVKGSRLALRDLSWPARGAAAVDLVTPTPGREGTLKARGTFSIEPTRLALEVEFDRVDLAPGRPYLPIDARLSGRLSGRAKVDASFGDTVRVVVDGDATAERLALGDDHRRLATVRRVELAGMRYRYPTGLRITQLTLDRPWLLLERDSSGRFELAALLATRRNSAPAPGGDAPAGPGPAPRAWLAIANLAMRDGFVRVVDRTTDPDYAEEISNIAVTATDLGTRASRRGKVALTGTFASGTPLRVHGEVGGFRGPRSLDVTVDIRDFPVPRVNPYLTGQLGWVATGGTLTASVHYRIDGDELEASNVITLAGLEVERASASEAGPPLDTIVSLLKNHEGVIKLDVPVRGSLAAPEFDYGDAVWAAMRNLAIRLVALPFSLVGKLFFTEDSRIRAVAVDPVTFEVAAATPTAAGAQQLDKLAQFLGAAPAIQLRLRPVTTVDDVGALRRRALDSRLAALGTDAAGRRRAAVGLYGELFPRRQPPAGDEALLEELTRETPTPPGALRDLAAARVAAVSDALVRAGIAPERLERLNSRAAVESEGSARVEFEIRP